jgi:hypothetical protein
MMPEDSMGEQNVAMQRKKGDQSQHSPPQFGQ